MAKTFGELILECQNYEYSKENYELTKECYELQLMKQYIESQEFLKENMDDIKEEFTEFDESYFGESVSSENMEAIYESFSKKAKGLANNIWKKLKDLWKKICNFFKRLFGRSKKTSEKAAEVLEKLKNLPKPVLAAALGVTAIGASAAVLNNISMKAESFHNAKEILNDVYNETFGNSGFIIANNQPYNKNLGLKITFSKDLKHVCDLLSVATSDSTIVIKSTGDMKIIPIETLTEVFKMVQDNPSKAKNLIDENIKKARSSGMVIYVTKTYFDNSKSLLDDVTAALNGVDDIIEAEKSAGMDTVATALKKVYDELMTISGNLMKLYTIIETYREKANRNINYFISEFKVKEDNKEE